MKGVKKILVAVNGSLKPLEKGLELARDEKSWLTVVKVVPPYNGDLNLIGIKDIEGALSGVEKETISKIKDMADSERALMKLRVVEGDIHQKIIDTAEEESCDLIIMGARRHSGWARIFGDRTVGKVINGTSRPVLVVDA
jgi:nucleotide-binding universal stress UspA family protein